MGNFNKSPVNEAVFFLDQFAPESLQALRSQYPELQEELQPGIMAGDAEDPDQEKSKRILLAKGRVMVVALEKAICMCDDALSAAVRKMKNARKARLGGQIVTVLGSSGVLGALSATQTTLASVSGVLALLGSLATVAAEYSEQIANPEAGKLNSTYLEIGEARLRATILKQTLEIYLAESFADTALEKAVADANSLCEHVHGKVFQIIEGVIGTRAELRSARPALQQA